MDQLCKYYVFLRHNALHRAQPYRVQLRTGSWPKNGASFQAPFSSLLPKQVLVDPLGRLCQIHMKPPFRSASPRLLEGCLDILIGSMPAQGQAQVKEQLLLIGQ
jgi:hypothetical protein